MAQRGSAIRASTLPQRLSVPHDKIMTRPRKLLTRRGGLVEEEGGPT